MFLIKKSNPRRNLIRPLRSIFAGALLFSIGALSIFAATPVVWLKADAITGVTSGSTLQTWTNASGGGYNATSSAPSQDPTYATNAMNGKPVVRFNSANSTCLTFARPVQDDFTIVCVFQSTQGLGSGNLYYL